MYDVALDGLPSFTQEQFLLARQRFRDRGIDPGTNVLPIGCRLPGRVDLAALNRAIRRLVARHDVLQCRFELFDGASARLAVRAPVPPATVASPEPGGEEELVRRLRALAEPHLKEWDWPLFRVCVVDGEPAYVLLFVHHLVADFQSLVVLRNDLEALYQAEHTGVAGELPAAGSFWAVSDAERGRFADPAILDQHLARWRRAVGDGEFFPRFPVDLVDVDHGAARSTIQSIEVLTAEEAAELRRRCVAHRATPFAAVAAAYGVALHRVVGVSAVRFMVGMSTRTDRDANTVGWFSGMAPCGFPVSSSADSRADYAATLRDACAAVSATLALHGLPYTEALRAIDPVSYRGDGVPYPIASMTLVDRAAEQPPVERAAGGGWVDIPMAPSSSRSHAMTFLLGDDGLAQVGSLQPHTVLHRIEAELAAALQDWVTG